MIHLMKLELRKIKLSSYLKGVLIAFFIAACFAALFLTILIVEKDTRQDFQGYVEFLMMPNVMTRAVFIVFSSIFLSRLVVDEYKNRTILLMFTYPVERKRFFLAKLILSFTGTVVFGFICNLAITSIVTVILSQLNIYDDITFANYMVNLKVVALSAIVCGFLSLIPFYFGMRKKSRTATMVSGGIIACLLSSTFGGINLKQDLIRLLISMAVSIGFVIITLTTKLHQLDEADV